MMDTSCIIDTQHMVRISLFILFVLGAGEAFSQLAPGKYWVAFTDKLNTPYSISNPEEFLGERAIQRRENQGIAVDGTDLPVDPNYIAQVLSLGEMELVNTSKWFNAIVVDPADSTVLLQVAQLPFVFEVKKATALGYDVLPSKPETGQDSRAFEEYGIALKQISMLNGHLLHEAGYTGQGMRIAVLDAGFESVPDMETFEPLFNSGRVVGTFDVVNGSQNVYHSHNHGTSVLSTMASYWPDSLIGSAFSAEYLLYRTENGDSEYPLEEVNWIVAAEMADSAGADVLNTSLGYTTFDDSTLNHSYASMDGQTTYISRGGNIAARKGMLVINSAGNSGHTPWKYISAPADADSVLAIGAVGPDSLLAAFSSRGPSFDGRVKPNVCAQGFNTVLASTGNTVFRGNGTSFSSPVLAGLAACLWQTNPTATNMQVFRAIEQSAHLYNNPNDSLGYGLPNFFLAQSLLDDMVVGQSEAVVNNLEIHPFPNPFADEIQLRLGNVPSGKLDWVVYSLSGKELSSGSIAVSKGQTSVRLNKDFGSLPAGAYLLRTAFGESVKSVVVQKVN